LTRLAMRMLILAAFQIALVLVAVILAGALFGFGFYVRALSAEMALTQEHLVAALQRAPAARADARSGGEFVASQYLPGDVEVIVLDATSRVAVYRLRRANPQPIVSVRGRADLSGEPHASGLIARLALALATAFGLESRHAHVGDLYIIVTINDAMLAATVKSFLLPLAVTLLAVALLAVLIARTLTRQTMLPLQQAFAERDRANAAMRRFIADAGHQLRTPLTIVQGFIDILRRNPNEAPQERARILDTMFRQCRIMSELIEKLILLDRWQREQRVQAFEPIDVGVLVSDLIAPVADAHPQRQIRVRAREGLMAAIDPSELGHVVTNLVDNALKYTSGTIDVTVDGDAEFVTIDVRDEGPGIAPHHAARIFDRFYRGPRRDVEGSGLGLAIARRAVERAHGSLTLESDPVSGSRFSVRLPRIPGRSDGCATKSSGGNVSGNENRS
jgi:signal transduction histidine kinase